MEKIILRTMTLKSKFTYGRFDGKTVEEVLGIAKGGYQYIRWVFFNIQNITFIDEILESAGIKGEWKIEKPGVDKGAEKRLIDVILCSIAAKNLKKEGKFNQILKTNMREHTIYKNNKIKMSIKQNIHSKQSLQRKNHGHK